jgi:hypothetical protein
MLLFAIDENPLSEAHLIPFRRARRKTLRA